MCLDWEICSQLSHSLFKQLFFFESLQFKFFAKILAIVVLPTPLIPVNKKAFGILFVKIDFFIVSTIISCPTRSSKI